MEIPVELVPLNCIRCGTAIPAEIDEVAWVCHQCEQAQQLGDQGLLPLKIHFAQGIPPSRKGRPFWVSEGRVNITRDTYGSLGKNAKDALQFWEKVRQFIIPAFPYPLDDFASKGVQWLRTPPALKPGPAVDFESVTIAADDVPGWAEFLVMALEAERKDKVKKIVFNLKLEEPQLWILP
jgi:hypothetical protein